MEFYGVLQNYGLLLTKGKFSKFTNNEKIVLAKPIPCIKQLIQVYRQTKSQVVLYCLRLGMNWNPGLDARKSWVANLKSVPKFKLFDFIKKWMAWHTSTSWVICLRNFKCICQTLGKLQTSWNHLIVKMLFQSHTYWYFTYLLTGFCCIIRYRSAGMLLVAYLGAGLMKLYL